MPNVEKSALVTDQPEASSLAGKLVPALLVGALVALAGGFWAANGPSVFAELISAAWSLCF